MAETKCTGNCMNCTILQRQYCASQLAYSNMRMLEQMQEVINSLQESEKELAKKIESLQNNEGQLFYPTISTDTAQEGDGAQVDAPEV